MLVELETSIDFDSYTLPNDRHLRMMSREGLTMLYAVYHHMEAVLWEQADEFQAFDCPNWKARNSLVTDALDKIAAAYIHAYPEDCFSWEFRGYHEGEESHYTIEEGIQATLGRDGISMDSESGWFVVNTTEAQKDALEAYLKANWKELDFTVEPADRDDVKPPEIGGWDKSKRMLDRANITVTIALPDLTPKSPAEIRDILAEAKKVLAQTRLPVEYAAALLIEAECRNV